jgi:hypothetical protein
MSPSSPLQNQTACSKSFDDGHAGGELIATSAVEVFARVVETRLEADGSARVVLEGGHAATTAEVRALRLPRG